MGSVVEISSGHNPAFLQLWDKDSTLLWSGSGDELAELLKELAEL